MSGSPRGGLHVVVTGTDPAEARGGVAAAISGYLGALEGAGVPTEFIATYRRPGLTNKWLPAARALRSVPGAVARIRAAGGTVVVYGHAGAGVSLWREGRVLAAARRAGAVTVMQLHAIEVDAYAAHPLTRRLLAFAVRPAHALGVLTTYQRERLEARGFRQPLLPIPDPLQPDFEAVARAASPARRSDGPVTVLAVARCIPGKGIDLLVRAAALLPDGYRVVVAGDGPERRSYEALARSLAPGRVTFSGWVRGEAKHQLYREADIFCLPTRHDSFGMGFIEAMCHALPVVALRHGPTPAVVADGESALLAGVPTPEALAERLLALRDPARRAAMGAAGRRIALERYGAAAIGSLLVREFEGLVKTGAGA